MDRLTYLANVQRRQVATRVPVKYWQAEQCGKVIAVNNSIALLRYTCRGLEGVTYHAIR